MVLAPMEDVTNLPFRLICKRIGGVGLLYTEFVSAMALHYGAQKSKKKMRVLPEERPLAIQIFGSEPDSMAAAAQEAEAMGADIVDINMGCWVPKVCKTGSGAALLKDPETAIKVVRSVIGAVKVPVSVKVRAGWDASVFAAPDLCRRFQDLGVAMITLHARFAKQGFEGEADWRLISQLREAVSIPLLGNGDVKTGADALNMISRTGCDGVMVGRAAISNPWALAGISAALKGDPAPPPPTLQEKVCTAIEHARGLVMFEAGVDDWDQFLDLPLPDQALHENRAIRHLRGQLPLYVKSIRHAARVREAVSRSSTIAEVEAILGSVAMPSESSADG